MGKPISVTPFDWHGSLLSRNVRSAPGVWYTGGYYEKIYQVGLRISLSRTIYTIAVKCERNVNKQ